MAVSIQKVVILLIESKD
jgi:hypothetical protein